MFGPASQLETDRRSSSVGLAADQRKLVSGREGEGEEEQKEEKKECAGVLARRHSGLRRLRQMEKYRWLGLILAASGELRRPGELVSDLQS